MNETKNEDKLSASAKVTRAAWRVMMLDKELIGISAISMVLNIIIFVVFVYAGFVLLPGTFIVGEGQSWASDMQYYLLVAAYLVVAYLVTNFFSGAISHGAFRRFEGENPTMNGSLVAASKKSGALIKYTGLQVTVGLIFTILLDRLPLAGKLTAILADMTWSVASMFSIPVIMSSDETNPLKVVKKSAKTFVAIWAESVFIGITLVALSVVATMGVMVVVLGLFGAGLALGSNALMIAAAVLMFAMFVALALLSSALNQIAMTAAYYYATTGKVPAGFDEELVRAMFRPKRKWLV
jgi:hypothetical protein